MSNTVLLKSAIERSGYKLSYLASKIGITPYSLTNSLFFNKKDKQCNGVQIRRDKGAVLNPQYKRG